MKSKGRIVVLEDDPLILPLLERWLGEAGYEVVAPTEDIKPELVIANAPDPQSAEALVDSLRLQYAAPILLLSARFHSGIAGSVVAARRLGVKRVLPKPFSRKQLLAAVRASVEG